MKRRIGVIVLMAIAASVVVAQETEPNPNELGIDTAQQRLQEISVSKFEDPGFWRAYIPSDHGIISHRRFAGAPADKTPLPEEESAGIAEADEYVLGVKVEYYRRGPTTITVAPLRPLNVPGIVKTISVWVVGRNYNHTLSVLVEDHFGNDAILPMGVLNFTGWKRLTVAVPPTLRQRDSHYNDRMGLNILGFVIEPDLTETYGSYFVYFDDLRVTTDLFAEHNRDADDLPDTW